MQKGRLNIKQILNFYIRSSKSFFKLKKGIKTSLSFVLNDHKRDKNTLFFIFFIYFKTL